MTINDQSDRDYADQSKPWWWDDDEDPENAPPQPRQFCPLKEFTDEDDKVPF